MSPSNLNDSGRSAFARTSTDPDLSSSVVSQDSSRKLVTTGAFMAAAFSL